MAGNFLAWDLTSDDIDALLTAVPIGGVTPGYAHEEIGWTPASTALLNRVRTNTNVPTSREGLPPHRYIELRAIGGSDAGVAQKIRNFASTAAGGWLGRLDRREPPILKSLSKDAQGFWKAGGAMARVEALIEELKKGNVSIEYYTMDGNEVGDYSAYG